MTKYDMIQAVMDKSGIYKYQAKAAIDAIFDEMQDALAHGEPVSIYGFGTFNQKESKPHPAVHPATKERITVPGHKRVVFRPGAELLRAVRAE